MIASFTGVVGRMERIDEGQPFLAIVDFAHSPVSLQCCWRPSAPWALHGCLIAVFGSAGLRDRSKRYLMGHISGRLADLTIITAIESTH